VIAGLKFSSPIVLNQIIWCDPIPFSRSPFDQTATNGGKFRHSIPNHMGDRYLPTGYRVVPDPPQVATRIAAGFLSTSPRLAYKMQPLYALG
jgi:hypothetical protein